MINVQQTEFWTDAETAKGRMADDALLDTVALDRATMVLDPPEPLVDMVDDPVTGSLAVSAPVESLLAELAAEEAEAREPVAKEEGARTPAEVAGTRPRHMVVPSGPPGTQFNMARFLTLTGSLDSVADEGRWYELPRRIFRPVIGLAVKRRITMDFLKDLRAPPRNAFICRHPRPAGWLKL